MIATSSAETLETAAPRRLIGAYGVPESQGDLHIEHIEPRMRQVVPSTLSRQGEEDRPRTGDRPLFRRSYYVPRPLVPSMHEEADAAVIQIWEGTVLWVDHSKAVMGAKLEAKIGQVPEHFGEIDLQWVTDQDAELVIPGAVFYLTMFKRRAKSGTIGNSEELRFRRRPSWSAHQVQAMAVNAEDLLKKFRASQSAE